MNNYQQDDGNTEPYGQPGPTTQPVRATPSGTGADPRAGGGMEGEPPTLGPPAAQSTVSAGPVHGESAESAQPEQLVQVPPVDIVETPDEIVILVELPGYTEEDIVLEGMNQRVQILAEREFDPDEETKLHLRERMSRAERVVQLPMPVNIENADATFENGVCRIEVPKLEEVRGHRIGFH